MPGGLLQLVATGAQNQLLNGNPSMTFFRTMQKRQTNFAMESVRLDFDNSSLQFPLTGAPTTFRCKVRRVTDLLHDCYFVFNLPDIWSPLQNANGTPHLDDPGFEFQWIENIGYNAIERATVQVNGVAVYNTNGEWFKLQSQMTHDANKRALVDQMVGNVPELNDPGNSQGRMFQYPHAIQVFDSNVQPEPTIRGRQIVVPLHFWFCEDIGSALPMIALQNGEVQIELRLRPVQELFTILDVKNTNGGSQARIQADPINYPMSLFLSPPKLNGTPTNTTLTNWFPDPQIEANYIYLTEGERAQVAGADQSFLIKQVQWITREGQQGPSDTELPFHNLVTRIIWVAQRSDRVQQNDYDNYTNWVDRKRRPIIDQGGTYNSPMLQLSTGALAPPSVAAKDIVIDTTLLLDAKERFATKPSSQFTLIQNQRHNSGPSLPGIQMYSFALDHNSLQPSGAINGSQFNRVILRNTLIQPVPKPIQPDGPQPIELCVYRNTVFSPRPTTVPIVNNQILTGISPADVVRVIERGKDNIIQDQTQTVTTQVESFNVLRVVSGLANLVFAS